MDPFQTNFHDFRTNKYPEFHISEFCACTLAQALGVRQLSTKVCESEELAFASFALVSLTSVHKIQQIAPGISGSP